MADETQEKPRALTVVGNTMLTDSAKFEHTWRVAKVFAGSQLIPAHLRNKVEDVMIALHVAERLKDDPLTVLQSIYLVSGKAGWAGSYMVARINQSGLIKGRITWTETGEGKDLAVTARAVLAETGEEVTATATMQMAIGEGWIKNAKYQTMPAHMLRWRSVSMLQRLYFPEVMLGMPTAEELEDQAPTVRDITPKEDRPTAATQLEEFSKAVPTAEVVTTLSHAAQQAPDASLVYGGAAGGSMADASPKPKRQRKPVPAPEPEPTKAAEQEPPAATPDPTDGFDPDFYLERVLAQLDDITLEELGSAHDVVKQTLAKHPQHLAAWNGARLQRERALQREREAMT